MKTVKYRWNQWRPVNKSTPEVAGKYEVLMNGWRGIRYFSLTEGWPENVTEWKGKPILPLSYKDSVKKMIDLRKKTKDVSVFVDRGWGDSGQETEYSIITDGNGQLPHGFITDEVFKELREKNKIGGNNLITYKARRNHPFINGRKSKDNSTLGNKNYRDTQPPVTHSIFDLFRKF